MPAVIFKFPSVLCECFIIDAFLQYTFDKPLTIPSQFRQLVGMYLDDNFTKVVPALHHLEPLFCRFQPMKDVRDDRHDAVLLNEFSGVF